MQGTSRNIARMVLAATVSVVAVGLGTVTAGAWGDVSREAQLSTNPAIGSKGTVVLITGSKFTPYLSVSISFIDAHGSQALSSVQADGQGAFVVFACIPWNATPGTDTILGESPRGLALGWTNFRVMGQGTARTPGVATGKRGTAKAPGLTSGKGGTAWTPGLTSGKGGTAWTPGLTSGKRGTARTPSLTSGGKGTARVPGLTSQRKTATGTRSNGNAALLSVCVGS